MRRICVITGTRAEYGLLYWVIKGIHDDPQLELQLIVTGMHLSPEFGLTVKEVEKDGFPIANRVEMLLSSDTETSIATSMGLGMIGFAKAYEKLRPDILVVLGDRFEIHAAVSAVIPFRIPVAHIHGGEITEGVMDDVFRHTITKMSHIHFPSTSIHAERIIQMGEQPENVFCFGAPGIDNIYKFPLLDKQQLAYELDLPMERKWGIITYHPVTLEKNSAKNHIEQLLYAIKEVTNIFWIFTFPNADTEGRIIMQAIEDYVKSNQVNSKIFSSLGQLRYLSMLKHAVAMVGNSSSGIIEAPSFELPVINIGDRQKGRVKEKNVIDVSKCEKNEILTAINEAISGDFRDSLRGLKNPYGNGNSSMQIVERLKFIKLDKHLIKKKFHEVLQ